MTPSERTAQKSAWIASEGETFLVTLPADSARSPISELIERIYDAESRLPVSRARRILRERIHANYTPTTAERETVKVAAKRIIAPSDRPVPTGTTPLPEPTALRAFVIEGLQIGEIVTREKVPHWLERLKNETARAKNKWTSDRPVTAMLVDQDQRLISYAWNTNAAIRTRHAEWNLCELLFTGNRKIPADAKLYVSLKPCRMCAARIWELAEDPARLEVVYFENDPGTLAQGTILEARSPARVRYLGLDHPLFATEISRLSSRSLNLTSR